MFFLFRCLFWLGLVFSHIATLEGMSATTLAQQTARAATEQAATISLARLGEGALDAAARQCAVHTDKCLAFAAQAARLTRDAGPSHDSLNAGDRVPAWRLRSGKAPDVDPSR